MCGHDEQHMRSLVFIRTMECKRREWFRRWESTLINSLKSIFTRTVTLYQNILSEVYKTREPSHPRCDAIESYRVVGRLWETKASFNFEITKGPHAAIGFCSSTLQATVPAEEEKPCKAQWTQHTLFSPTATSTETKFPGVDPRQIPMFAL